MKVYKRKISASGDVLQFVVYRLPPLDGGPRCEFRVEKLTRYRGCIWVSVFRSKELCVYSRKYAERQIEGLFGIFREKFETDFQKESEAMDVADAMSAINEVLAKS